MPSSNATQNLTQLVVWHSIVIFLLPPLIIFGILGNSLVLFIYQCRWRRNTTTTLLIRALALIDLSKLVIAYPILLSLTFDSKSPDFDENCQAYGFILLTGIIASDFILVIAAIDRFRKAYSGGERGVSWMNSVHLLLGGLLLAVLVNVPTLLFFGRQMIHPPDTRQVICFVADDRDGVVFMLWLCQVILILAGNLTLLVTLYASALSLKNNTDELQDDADGQQLQGPPPVTNQATPPRDDAEAEVESWVEMRATTKTFIAVSLLHLSSYMMCLIVLVLAAYVPRKLYKTSVGEMIVVDILRFSPLIMTIFNPIVYSRLTTSFRTEVENLVTCNMVRIKGRRKTKARKTV